MLPRGRIRGKEQARQGGWVEAGCDELGIGDRGLGIGPLHSRRPFIVYEETGRLRHRCHFSSCGIQAIGPIWQLIPSAKTRLSRLAPASRTTRPKGGIGCPTPPVFLTSGPYDRYAWMYGPVSWRWKITFPQEEKNEISI